jgi:F-type H+-transporting ATPase subunit alpha
MAVDLKAEEITEIIRQQLSGIGRGVDVAEVGTVISVGDGIARVYGLDRVMAGELVAFPHNVAGLALNLEEDNVGCVLLGEYQHIKEGDEVRRTGKIMSVPVGPAMVGRVVSPPSDRRQGSDQYDRVLPDRTSRARRRRPQARQRAAADRTQGH